MPQGGQQTPLSPSLVQRAVEGIRYIISGVTPSTWFGPMQPLAPMAPPEVAGRQFDYPVGYNLTVTPRAEERISFAQLRALADSYDLLRLVVETRKDQVERLEWSIRRRALPGGDPADRDHDPRIAAIEAFFRMPDRVHFWSTWLRQLLEDLFVVDAPALHIRRTRGGQLYALELIDGTTIKRLINADGRTPDPPDPAYQQVLHGVPAADFTTDELIYRPRNLRTHRLYGYSPVEQVVMTVNIALRRQLHQLSYYTEGNVPEALIGTPESWSPTQIKEFQQYWDALLEGNLAQRRHAKFVPGGVAKTFIPTKEVELKSAYDEWLARVICFAFSVSPQAFIDHMNRATAETAQSTALAEGLAPIRNWVKQLVDYVILTEFAAPDLEFTWRDESASDPEKQASVAQIYVTNGIKTINETRAEIGLDPVEGGDAPLVFTGSGPVALSKVGSLGKYSADQPRVPKGNPGGGQWTGGEGRGGAEVPGGNRGGRRVASNDTVVSDARDTPVRQQAQGEEEPLRSGRHAVEETDPMAEVRQELFDAAVSRLRAIDPNNRQAASLHGPDWVPSEQDVQDARSALDDAVVEAAGNAARHAYEEHVVDGREFPEINSPEQLELEAQRVIRTAEPEFAPNGRTLFYDAKTNTLVIVNTAEPEQSSIFRPEDRRAYVDRQLSPKSRKVMDVTKLASGSYQLAVTENEWDAMKNCLNEVCHGLRVPNFEQKIGVAKDVASKLLDETIYGTKTAVAGDDDLRLTLTSEESRIFINAMKATIRERSGEGIMATEYFTRVGATIAQVKELISKLQSGLE